jgi:hypothetical protein
LLSALVAASLQFGHAAPAEALAGDTGPAEVPLSDTSGLTSPVAEWETKNQHRVWRNGSAGRWDAILPAAATTASPPGPATGASDWWIAKGVIGATPVFDAAVNTSSAGRPDVYWDEAGERLYVLVSGRTATSFSAFDYNSGTDTYSLAVGPVALPGMETAASRASIYRTPNGYLWAATMVPSGLLVAQSTNEGASWTGPVKLIDPLDEGQTQLTHFTHGGTTQLALAAAEDGDGNGAQGRLSKYLFYAVAQDDATWNTVTMAQGTLTMDVMPSDGDTLTVDGKTYTYQTVLTDSDGNIAIGGSLAQAQLNLVSAFALSGVAGVDYAASTKGHPTVSIDDFGGDQAVLTAKESGIGGNLIATTETFTATTNMFDGGTLGGTTLGTSPWTSEELPLTSSSGQVHADDELSLVKDGSDNIFIATETQGVGNINDPQVVLFKRTAAGVWTQTTVKTDQPSRDFDRKRPAVAILDSDIYVITVAQNRSSSGYLKAPLSTLSFPGPVTAPPWTPLFEISSERVRNNIVPRFAATSSTGLPVLVDNLEDDTVWQTILPNSGNQPPGVSAGLDQVVDTSTPANLLGQVTNDGVGDPLTIQWSTVSGPGLVTFGNAAMAQTTANFGALGDYVLRLSATESGTDPLANADEVRITVQASNQPPVLTVIKPAGETTAEVGEPVAFEATAIDPEAGNISADIVWVSNRDGQISPVNSGGSFVATDLSVGAHTITASVTDGQHLVSSSPIVVTIGVGDPEVFVLGGSGAVSDGVVASVGSVVGSVPERLAGPNR